MKKKYKSSEQTSERPKSLEQISKEHREIIKHATRPHETYEFANTTYGRIMTALTYFKFSKQPVNLHKITDKETSQDTKFVVGLNKGAGFAMLDYVYGIAQNSESIDRKIEIVESLLGPEQMKSVNHGDLSINQSIYLKMLEQTYVNIIEKQMQIKKYKR